MRTLWMVGGGVEAVRGIQRAREMGLRVIVSDGDPNAPGFECANVGLAISTYDVATHVGMARDIRPDGVIAMCADVPLTVAAMTQELGLPGHSMKTAWFSSDKWAQRVELKQAGIPIPDFFPISSHRDLVANANRLSPTVLKPVDSRGARGCLRISRDLDLRWAFDHAMSYSQKKLLILENWLEGPQISTESIVSNGEFVTPGFVDRNYDHTYWPYLVENGGQQPTALSEKDKKSVIALHERACRALGIVHGTAKGDMVLTKEGPKVIEIAARLSGGYLATDQIPLGTGVDFVGLAIRLALGEEVDLEEARPKFEKAVAIRYRMRGSEKNHTERGPHRIGTGASVEEAIQEASQAENRGPY